MIYNNILKKYKIISFQLDLLSKPKLDNGKFFLKEKINKQLMPKI